MNWQTRQLLKFCFSAGSLIGNSLSLLFLRSSHLREEGENCIVSAATGWIWRAVRRRAGCLEKTVFEM